MKTYTLTESELQELLRQQRMICASKVKSDPKKFWLEIDINSILDAPSPLLPTEEVGIKEDDCVASVQPKDLASLASHSCTIGNSIQRFAQPMFDWIKKYYPQIDISDEKQLSLYTAYHDLRIGIDKLNSDKNVPVSDTTEADSSNADGNKRIPSIDWEGLGNDMEDWLYNNWQGQSLGEKACLGAVREYHELLKIKLQDYIK